MTWGRRHTDDPELEEEAWGKGMDGDLHTALLGPEAAAPPLS